MTQVPHWYDAWPIALTPHSRAQLAALPHHAIAKGKVLFRSGDQASAFVIVLSGRIDVMLTGPTGREIRLYAVESGQSCIQTTLGLLGDDSYTGTAHSVTDVEVVLIPKPLFLALMDDDAGFRRFVMRAFGARMADLAHVLEQVAFGRVDVRLATLLLELAQNGQIRATHADLAARIGSAREVISRQLQSFAALGLTRNQRGGVVLLDATALRQISLQTL